MHIHGMATLSQSFVSRTSKELCLPQLLMYQLPESHLLHRGPAAARLGQKINPSVLTKALGPCRLLHLL